VLRKDLPGLADILAALKAAFANTETIVLDRLTDGQARTCLLGLGQDDLDLPVTMAACDNGVLFDSARFEDLFGGGADVLVWAVRGHPEARRHPQMFGWIDAEPDGRIRGVSVKVPLADTGRDPIVIGAFTFRRASDFVAAAERMIARDARVNGEFYVDTCINDAIALGLDCRVMEVDHYLGWGTPDDLRTFEYWQSCFHKWPSHPYRLEKDRRVPSDALAQLAERYAPRRVPRPTSRAARGQEQTAR
jgi:hypothetical protein